MPLAGAEGLAPVALCSQFGSWSGERFRSSRTPQRNFLAVRFAVAKGALSKPRRRGVGRYAGACFSASGPRIGDGLAAVFSDRVAGRERSPSSGKLFRESLVIQVTIKVDNKVDFLSRQ